MRALKAAYEAKHPGVTLNLAPGVSRQLAERILNGEACDVFASSSPAVIDEDLMDKPIGASGKIAATWYVVFSANEMVVITAKGNPLGIRKATDLAKPGVRFVRVTGDKDLATARTVGIPEARHGVGRQSRARAADRGHRASRGGQARSAFRTR